MSQIQVITGVERRRQWSDDQKLAIVAAAFTPGAVVSEVARRMDVSSGLIYRWRKDLRALSDGFAQVVVAPNSSARPDPTTSAIEVVFGDNTQVRVPASTPPSLAAAVIQALVRR